MVKFGSIGSAAKECVPGLQPFHVLQGVDEFGYFWFVLLDLFPLTPPHFNNLVPASTKGNRGTAGMLPNFIHFSTGVPVVHFRLIRVAGRTSMVVASVVLVHDVSFRVISIYSCSDFRYKLLTTIAGVHNVSTVSRMAG